jgi:Rrf2 family nitric oxide-sensitive transcriptional repressor
MKLQISTQLAVYALLELAAHSDRQLSVAQIGVKYNVSGHHLAKVMQVLSRAKLVRSVRGVGGGYQFVGNARRTTLLDVVLLFEDFAATGIDRNAPGKTTEEGRALRDILGEIADIARATLGSITIATMLKLVEGHRSGRPIRAHPTAPSEH